MGTLPVEARLIRFHVKPRRTVGGRALYRVIVERARKLGIAGASVFPVAVALGTSRSIGELEDDYTSAEVPVVVEIVDAVERIDHLLADLGPLREGLFVTLEPVQVLPGNEGPKDPEESGSDGAGRPAGASS